MKKCQNCQYYDRSDPRSTDGRTAQTMWGQCRRHSPLLNPQNDKQYMIEGIWPVVRDDDWCGEWFAPAQGPMPRTHGLINGQELMAAAINAAETAGGSRPAPESRPVSAAVGDD